MNLHRTKEGGSLVELEKSSTPHGGGHDRKESIVLFTFFPLPPKEPARSFPCCRIYFPTFVHITTNPFSIVAIANRPGLAWKTSDTCRTVFPAAGGRRFLQLMHSLYRSRIHVRYHRLPSSQNSPFPNLIISSPAAQAFLFLHDSSISTAIPSWVFYYHQIWSMFSDSRVFIYDGQKNTKIWKCSRSISLHFYPLHYSHSQAPHT